MRMPRLAVLALVALGCKTEPLAPSREGPAKDAEAPPIGAALSSAPDATTAERDAATAAASELCHEDAECTVSSFPGCCSCCPCGPLQALTVSREATRRAECATKNCRACPGIDGKCAPCADPAKEGMQARCIASTCTLVENKVEKSVQCKSDDDCWLDERHAPISRPAKLRGKKVRPCTDSEHAPSCREGVCVARHFKC